MKMILSKCKYICALVVITTLLATGLVASVQASTIYNVPGDWATIQANSTLWTAMYSTNTDWNHVANGLAPMVADSATVGVAPGGQHPWLLDSLWRTAGGTEYSPRDAALVFTAPKTGTYSLSGYFLYFGMGADAALYNTTEVWKSTNPTAASTYLWGHDQLIPTGSESYWDVHMNDQAGLQNISLNAGDQMIILFRTMNTGAYTIAGNRLCTDSGFGNWGAELTYVPEPAGVLKTYNLSYNSLVNPDGPFTLACKHTGSWTSYNTLDLMRFVSGSTWTGYFDPANPLDAWYPYYFNSPDALWRICNINFANQPLVYCFKVPEDGFYSLDAKWVAQSWGTVDQGPIELTRSIYLADSSSSAANLVFSDVSNWPETAKDQRIVDLSAIQPLQNRYLLKDSFVFFEMKCLSSTGYQVVDMWFSKYTSSDISGRITYSCGKPGDISGPFGSSDCKVDFYDFAAMAQDWMVNDNYSPAEYGNATN